ncbi:MAG: hypothetical protein Q9198_008192 [Flavoplaca austrocitrina]
MDFPNVSLVVQVGLPSDADAYTHRVGRTARAGKDGRAVILLTDAESFYLRINPQFPIKSHPASAKIQASLNSPSPIIPALQSADPASKDKAYAAYLGFMKTSMNKMQLNTAGLKRGLSARADVAASTRKMGLKGAPGISYAAAGPPRTNNGRPTYEQEASQQKGRVPQNKRPAPSASNREKGPSRRQRHQ